MDDLKFKQLATFAILGVTVAWAGFCVWFTYYAISTNNQAASAIAAMADAVTGALLMKFSDSWQYWFRKKPGDTAVKRTE